MLGHSGLAQVVKIFLFHRLADRGAGFRKDRTGSGLDVFGGGGFRIVNAAQADIDDQKSARGASPRRP